jgi:N-acyl-D-aspartate/D-glutamate deacylase
MHDLIIRGGTIADGSGKPTCTGDIAVDGSIVTAVGLARRDDGRDGQLRRRLRARPRL